MTRWPVVFACVFTVPSAAAQTALDAAYDSARYAWEEGRYVAALTGFDRLLAAPGGERFLEPVALLTGELYHTVTVAPDGRAIQWSPDGRFASYETGEGVERRIHVLRFEGGGLRPAVELAGLGLVFSPDGARAAYFAVGDPPELRAMRGALDSLLRVRALDERRRRLAEAQRLEARLARVVIRDLVSGREREVAVPDLVKRGLAYGGGGGETLFLVASRAAGDPATTDIYAIGADGAPRPITEGPGLKGVPLVGGGGARSSTRLGRTEWRYSTSRRGAPARFQARRPRSRRTVSRSSFSTGSGTPIPSTLCRCGTRLRRWSWCAPETGWRILPLRPTGGWWRTSECRARTGRFTWRPPTGLASGA